MRGLKALPLLGGLALFLGACLVGLSRRGGNPVLLSAKSSSLAGIERWERQALSGASKEGGDGLGEVTTARGVGGVRTKARDVEAMVQEWEDKTLSGRKGSTAAAEAAKSEEHSVPVLGSDGVKARGAEREQQKQHEAMARQADASSSHARASVAAAALPDIQESAVASAPVASDAPTTSPSSSASKQGVSSSSRSSRGTPSAGHDYAPPKPRIAPAAVPGKPAVGSSAAATGDKMLETQAQAEERKASQLVGYADRVAQKIIKEKALDAMKRWLAEQRHRVAEQRKMHASASAGSGSSRGGSGSSRGGRGSGGGHLHRVKHSVHRAAVHGGLSSIASDEERLKRALDEVQEDTRRLDSGDVGERKEAMAELTADVREAKEVGERVVEDKQTKQAAVPKVAAVAVPHAKAAMAATKAVAAPKAATKKTPEERIRDEYEAWRKSRVHDYAQEHNLFSANEFCNSRQNADHPTVGEMIKLFGDQWRSMAVSNPEVATLAAVSPCLAALGVGTPGVATKSVYAQAWKKGPLAGKEGAVKKCAGGDRKACVEIAKDPDALRELKALIPNRLISKK